MLSRRITVSALILMGGARCAFSQAEGTILWTYKGGNLINAAPSLGTNGTVYVAPALSANGPTKLTALNRNGQKEWDFEVEGIVISGQSIATDGTLYFGTAAPPESGLQGKLYALNADGTKKWEFAPEVSGSRAPRISGTPALGTDGTIYFGAYTPTFPDGRGRFFAINPDGTERWRFSTTNVMYSSPAVAEDGTIYINSTGDKLYALRPDGSKYWELRISVNGPPAIAADGIIYAPAFNGLYAVHPDGSILWKVGETQPTPPVIGIDGTIYCHMHESIGGGPGSLYAIMPTGFVLWSRPMYVYGSSTVAADGTIYVPDSGRFIALYPNGFQKWDRGSVGGENGLFTAAALRNDGVLIVCQGSGTVYAIKASCGLANTPWPVEGRNNRRTGRASPGEPVEPCMGPLRLARDRGFQFTMIGEVGKSYTLEVAEGLGTWRTLTNLTFARPVEHFTDSSATNVSFRFYRAVGQGN